MARGPHTDSMLGHRAVVRFLAIVVLLLGTTFHVAPYDAGMGHGTELTVTQGMPGGCGACDRGHLPATVACQASCTSIAAAFVTVSPLLPSERKAGWLPVSDVRGSGRELVPDPPPPKSSGII